MSAGFGVEEGVRRIPYYRHDLGQAELRLLQEVLAQPILTTGEYVERAERALEDLLDVKHALCVTSCTGALHIALLALQIGPGDEVITTPMTFIATATAILQAGAKPVFVDVEPETGNLDAEQVVAAITDRTRAILPVHLYGLMCDMQRLRAIADRNGLAIVEDAAHCLEGHRDGVRAGQIGEIACFSFYATKNLTCGEGGAVVTNDTALYERLKCLRHHGMTKTANDRHREGYTHWDMPVFGWKYNMSNIEAAILLPQFERLEPKLAQRQALARHYVELLRNAPGVTVPAQTAGRTSIHAHHIFPVWVQGHPRDVVLKELQKRGVEVVVNYNPVHLMSYFRETFGHRAGQFPVAEAQGSETVSLPFFPGLEHGSAERVVFELRAALS